MNRELRRVSIVVIAMFLTLFVSTTIIQVFQAPALDANPRNVRALEDAYTTKRGAILVGGTPIAQSVPSDDRFKYQRTYADGELYSQITGYFTINQGSTGIERALNDQLSGTSSDSFLERLNGIVTGQEPQGNSVNLTIDAKVQQAAWDALGDQRGAVIAIEPKTGRILALVSKPTFDPNSLASHDTKQVLAAYNALNTDSANPLYNRATNGALYPPGSVMKVLMASALIDSGKFTSDSQIANPPQLTLDGTNTTITNSDGELCGGTPEVSLFDALRLSCNIPFAQFGLALGQDTMREYAERFGFNRSVDIPMQSTPSVFPAELDNPQTELAAFGQDGVRANPLQIAMDSMAVANGGTIMKPTLVDSVVRPDLSQVQSFSPQTFATPISSQTAQAVTQMMVASVASGAATNARINGVDVAGKTGTAENGTNDPYTLWFTGFAPAQDPKVVVAVVVENGGGRGQSAFGNTFASPIGRSVIQAVLGE